MNNKVTFIAQTSNVYTDCKIQKQKHITLSSFHYVNRKAYFVFSSKICNLLLIWMRIQNEHWKSKILYNINLQKMRRKCCRKWYENKI